MDTYNKSIMDYDDVILAVNYAKEKGEKLGEKRGERKARKEERIRLVQNCYKNGLSIEQTAKLTGLTKKRVSAIISTMT